VSTEELPASLRAASFSDNPVAMRDDYRVRLILTLPFLQV
jgi:hypothetical protein